MHGRKEASRQAEYPLWLSSIPLFPWPNLSSCLQLDLERSIYQNSPFNSTDLGAPRITISSKLSVYRYSHQFPRGYCRRTFSIADLPTHHVSLIRIAGVLKQDTSIALQMISYKSRMLNHVEQHHLILVRWKWIFFVKNPRFWNAADILSDALPLLSHAFDNVHWLRPTQFSTDSNDKTHCQAVMLTEFSQAVR